MTKLHELEIPDGVIDEEEASEFVRFWIGGGEDHVTLNIGAFDSEQEASSWGMIAADIVKHALRGMCQDDPTRDPEKLLAEIEKAFHDRLNETTNVAGQLRGDLN
ncbi:MAG: DUF5076 domain-containing protein [Pseudomonadota bacterium]